MTHSTCRRGARRETLFSSRTRLDRRFESNRLAIRSEVRIAGGPRGRESSAVGAKHIDGRRWISLRPCRLSKTPNPVCNGAPVARDCPHAFLIARASADFDVRGSPDPARMSVRRSPRPYRTGNLSLCDQLGFQSVLQHRPHQDEGAATIDARPFSIHNGSVRLPFFTRKQRRTSCATRADSVPSPPLQPSNDSPGGAP
jgi:hypothetical protein